MATKQRLKGGLRIAAALTASALVLTACGQADNIDPTDAPEGGGGAQPTAQPPAGNEGDVTLRFSWWGSDIRHQLNQEVIAAFEASHPGIKVTPDFGDWSGYWDKLSTQVAGGSAPDVIMMDLNYVREYATNGVLADLNDIDLVEKDDIDPALIGAGEFNGGLWALPTGANIVTMIADPQIFDEAGVEFPDDENWTWEEYVEIATAISANTPDGVYGGQDQLHHEAALILMMRQHGVELWGEDGDVTADPDVMADMWNRKLELIESGGYPPNSVSVEVENGGIEQYLVSTNRGGMQMTWSNQLIAVETASGRELELLRYPGEKEYERTGSYLKSSMLLSMSARTQHPEEAATFLNWMQNSTEAGELILADRGIPSNLTVRDHVSDMLTPTDQQVVAFIDKWSDTIIDAANVPPVGTGQILQLLAQLDQEVGFGQTTPEEAAERFVTEANQIAGG